MAASSVLPHRHAVHPWLAAEDVANEEVARRCPADSDTVR